MNFTELNKITRQNVLNAIEELSLAQLNEVPAGRNNSIFWNLAHMLVTQQLLTLGLHGANMLLPNSLIAKYRKGSSGEVLGTAQELELIKKEFLDILDRTNEVLENNIHSPYTQYTTSYNVTLSNIYEAIEFNNVHDALHFGVIMAIKKQVV